MNRVIVVLFSSVLVGILGVSLYTEANDKQHDTLLLNKELQNVMRDGIKLNEDFKAAVNKVSMEEYTRKQKTVEEYYEATLIPSLRQVVEVLSRDNNEIELASTYLDVLVSYQNTADEMLSMITGALFYENPNFVSMMVGKRSMKERKIIYDRLADGWESILHRHKLTDDKQKKYVDILKKIESSLN